MKLGGCYCFFVFFFFFLFFFIVIVFIFFILFVDLIFISSFSSSSSTSSSSSKWWGCAMQHINFNCTHLPHRAASNQRRLLAGCLHNRSRTIQMTSSPSDSFFSSLTLFFNIFFICKRLDRGCFMCKCQIHSRVSQHQEKLATIKTKLNSITRQYNSCKYEKIGTCLFCLFFFLLFF